MPHDHPITMREGYMRIKLRKDTHAAFARQKGKYAIVLKRNIGTHADNRPPTVMHSQVDIQRYSVANIITKTSATEAISLNIIFYCILLLLLCIYY